MRLFRRLVLVGLAAMAVTAFPVAGSASATTLELTGVAQNQSLPLTLTLVPGTTTIFKTTAESGFPSNTCTASHIAGSTIWPFTGSTITAPVSTMTFGQCDRSVTVEKGGTLHIQHIPGTTNGTVTSSGAEIRIQFGGFGYHTAKTGVGTHIGTLIGVKDGHSRLQVNAVLNTGFLIPSATWEGEYIVTGPTYLGVVE